jgi:hypothetical protein
MNPSSLNLRPGLGIGGPASRLSLLPLRKMSMKERRKLQRFKLRLPARIEVSPQTRGEEAKVLKLETDNICSGGAFFHTLSPLPEGTPVKAEIVLDTQRFRYPKDTRPLINIRGHVLRTEPTGMAIRFMKDFRILPHSSV